MNVEQLISELQLVAHPEGGYYREMYRSSSTVVTGDGHLRSALTNIYFLLAGDDFSAWHRIDADETWHFYRGTDLVILIIDHDGTLEERRVGPGGPWQTTMPAKRYFSAHVADATGFALIGCSVAPGFEFSTFELAARDALITQYPQHESVIKRFTRS